MNPTDGSRREGNAPGGGRRAESGGIVDCGRTVATVGDGTTINHIVPEQAGAGSSMAGMTLDITGAWHNLAAFTTARPFVTTYGYDRLYELTSARAPGVESSYVYDPAGNRA